MASEVCVVVETLRGKVTESAYTALAAGRHLADALKTQLWALLMGQGLEGAAQCLGVADRIVGVEHAALAAFNPEAFGRVVEAVFRQNMPRVGIFGHTATGTDLVCALAQRLELPCVVSCRTFRVQDGQPRYASLTCGGKIIAEGPIPGPACLATVMAGGYKPEDGRVERKAPLEKLAPPEGLATARTQFKQFIEPPAGDVDITRQPILVSVGRGIQNRDNIALAEKLAQAMGGVVSGSRPTVDRGWLPTTRLVGKSGKQVRPKLYLALGISGAPEHLEGIPGAELMIAVNTDAKAPIFDVAQYGATCDVLKLLPVLTEKIGGT